MRTHTEEHTRTHHTANGAIRCYHVDSVVQSTSAGASVVVTSTGASNVVRNYRATGGAREILCPRLLTDGATARACVFQDAWSKLVRPAPTAGEEEGHVAEDTASGDRSQKAAAENVLELLNASPGAGDTGHAPGDTAPAATASVDIVDILPRVCAGAEREQSAEREPLMGEREGDRSQAAAGPEASDGNASSAGADATVQSQARIAKDTRHILGTPQPAPPTVNVEVNQSRSSLESMAPSMLLRTAHEEGLDEALIEEAVDGDNSDSALIELILNHRTAGGERARLLGLRPSALQKLAWQEGASEEAIAKAWDSADRKHALAELILATKPKGNRLSRSMSIFKARSTGDGSQFAQWGPWTPQSEHSDEAPNSSCSETPGSTRSDESTDSDAEDEEEQDTKTAAKVRRIFVQAMFSYSGSMIVLCIEQQNIQIRTALSLTAAVPQAPPDPIFKMDACTLQVRNIPFDMSCDEEWLRDIFGEYILRRTISVVF